MTQPTCRSCGAALTQTLVDLGLSPLANSYVPPERAGTACPRYPLHAWVCNNCHLVQVEDAVPADEIFNADYAYFSSYSDSWLAHAKAYVERMVDRFDLGPDDLVIEIASNDGYLLQYFVEKGIPVLGIEPSGSVAAAAEEKGVRTLVDYFGKALAQKVAAAEKPPALIASANVLAHVPDINDFVAGIATLLTGDAVYTVEFPHLLNLINEVQFDTIYHEHYSYLSLLAVEAIFAKAGLRVFDVEELPTHGGSLRVFACLEGASHPEGSGVAKVRADEAAAQFDRPEGYMNFTTQVEALRDGLLAFLREANARGDTIAAYGAAAKGNTLLNYAGIGPDLISYCVDRNPAKQNTLLPGSHIPVHGVEALRETPPDYVLILPWNIRDEVIDQMADLKAQGTRFVTAVPEVRIS
ncbi:MULTISPECIES: class I SAM-dependent methyltransferase [unclassified Ruegeria]|uniref:class I SAM-dependent methyltransferase n=1 Tax=unclassified Ruegeria TaxID=2625375 RepID=UPI0014917582|nr:MULTISPECIES: class I SAM-dependent methyltransferase [unclassified Ruegeria]NOD49792.1 methyltransferase domain-containing protein [Ruegeria sp. HKCCD5849]NOD54106.1 methyltransferase domain-containing protein [Ruegeria sp. HKCCD5851]NOD70123.1 methyltransferase domain-containing protein [Ruegeria sp. HKCCD7303]